MKQFIAAICCLSSLAGSAQQSHAGGLAIMGKVSNVPGVTFRADTALIYKIVIEINNSDTANNQMSPAFDLVARLVNLLEMDGIGPEKRSIAVIVHNVGSYSIQTDEAYIQRFGRPNPNRKAIEALHQNGVAFYVCGQSTVKRKILPEQVLLQVQIATSFLTSYATFQLKGYASLAF